MTHPPIPTSIKAIRDDAEYPELAANADNPADVTAAKRAQPQPKENTTMSLNPVHITAPRPDKIAIPGINASNSQERLITVLDRMGLVPRGLDEPLKKLAAAGQRAGDHWKVSVWKLDEVLSKTDASITNRMAFKASLDHAGLLSVEK